MGEIPIRFHQGQHHGGVQIGDKAVRWGVLIGWALVMGIIVAMLASCTVRLTPRQQMIWAGSVYTQQYDLWLEQALKPDLNQNLKQQIKTDPDFPVQDQYLRTDLTEQEIDVLNTKRRALVEVEELLDIADAMLESGGNVSPEVQRKIIEKINILLGEV